MYIIVGDTAWTQYIDFLAWKEHKLNLMLDDDVIFTYHMN